MHHDVRFGAQPHPFHLWAPTGIQVSVTKSSLSTCKLWSSGSSTCTTSSNPITSLALALLPPAEAMAQRSHWGCIYSKGMTHSAKGPWNKSWNFIFPIKYVVPKSLKVGHWLSETMMLWYVSTQTFQMWGNGVVISWKQKLTGDRLPGVLWRGRK